MMTSRNEMKVGAEVATEPSRDNPRRGVEVRVGNFRKWITEAEAQALRDYLGTALHGLEMSR